MHRVDAQVAGTRLAEEGVQVGPVAVHEPAAGVHDLADARDVLLEEAQRVRVGEHQTGHVLAHGGRDGIGVEDPVVSGGHGPDRVAVERRTRRVRAVRRVGNENRVPVLTALLVVGADHHESCEFSLGARCRLQRHAVHARDFRELHREFVAELEEALLERDGLHGVSRGEAREACRPLVELRVVLHGAGAERVETQVDRCVPGREASEVAHHIDLGDLGQAGDVVPQSLGGQDAAWIDAGNVGFWYGVADAPGPAPLE